MKKMTGRLRGKAQIAILFTSFATVFVILDQMFWNANYTTLNHNKEPSNPGSDAYKSDHEKDSQRDRPYYNHLTHKINHFSGQKLVHLDLKGAPPLVSYFKEFFPYLKKIGATGLLIEYEDMFPYSGPLRNITALNAYTPTDIKTILELAEASDLEVMPLIQTFGHFEFILKLEQYRELREVDKYPQVLCPSHPRTMPLIQKMIDQMIDLHPKITYIHIGCDEVYYTGECDRCAKRMMDNHWKTSQLFLQHVKSVAEYINQTYPKIKPVVWDDMFQKTEEELILEYKIPELVDVMVWKYVTDVSYFITDELLQKYARIFKKVWIASAFKGATGPDQMVTDAHYHLANHVSWMDIVSRWKNDIEFKGIAITGWQRYDHFSVLCELLPVGIPSLTVNLLYLLGTREGNQETALQSTLECDYPISLSPSDLKYVNQYRIKCNFPGFQVYHVINKLYLLIEEIKAPLGSTARGWFALYNVVQKFSSPAHVEEPTENLETRRIDLKYLSQELQKAMSDVFDQHTIDEFMLTHIVPLQLRLDALSNARELLLEQNTWPRRPLPNGAVSLRKTFDQLCNSTKSIGCGLLFI